MNATNERDIAMDAATTGFERAFEKSLVLARKVSQPWYRCQALAQSARYAREKDVVRVAEEAIAAALMATDSYQQVAATAWPFRALIERNQEPTALRLLPGILELSDTIENPVSRSDALFLLWEAFFPIEGHRSILGVLITSCNGHWKADYLLRQIVLIVASENHEEAHTLASAMREGKYKRQAEKRLASGETHRAREFFHR